MTPVGVNELKSAGTPVATGGWGKYWREIGVGGFIGLLALWLTFKPGAERLYTAVCNIAQFVGPMLAVAICAPLWMGRRSGRKRASASAVCLLLGVLGFAVGQVIWSYYEIVLQQELPFPSWADAGFVASYLFLAVGVLRLPSRPIPVLARWRIMLDSVTSLTALVTYSWYFILAPQLAQAHQSRLGMTLGMFYPLADLALLFCVLMLSGGRLRSGMRGGIVTLAAGLICIITVDTAFAYGTLNGTYVTGGLLDLLWPLGYMLIGLAVWKLHKADVAEPSTAQAPDALAPVGPSLLQSLLPYAFMPPAIALLCFVYGFGSHDWRSWGVYGGAAILMLLVLARQFFVVCENEQLYRRLREMHDKLARHHGELEAMNRQLVLLATTDGMTMLANHRALLDRLRDESARSRRSGESVALLLLDVDHFKSFNDSFGHQAGDEVLKRVAAVMRSCVRESDLTARYGGEEFAVVIPGADQPAAADVAERIRILVAEQRFAQRPVTVSVGVASIAGGFDPDELINIADKALYRAKAAGRNQLALA